MLMKSHYSLHALDRLSSRLHLSPATGQKVLRLLDEGRCIPLWREAENRVIHRLIYVESLTAYFRVVQDESNGEVITLCFAIPKQRHESFNISKQIFERAKTIATAKRVFDLSTLPGVKEENPLLMLRVAVQMRHPDANNSKIVKLNMPLNHLDEVDNLPSNYLFNYLINARVKEYTSAGFSIELISAKVGDGCHSASFLLEP
jgi:hypothetical protein